MIDTYSCAVGFERGRGLISKGIQRLTAPDIWTPSHAFFYSDEDTIMETHIGTGVRQYPSSKYCTADIRVYAPTFLDAQTKRNMIRLASYTLGDRYGILTIPLFALDGVFDTFWFTQTFGLSNFKVCSQWASWLFNAVPTVAVNQQVLLDIAAGRTKHAKRLGYEFGQNWKTVPPNAMQNWCESHSEEWVVHA